MNGKASRLILISLILVSLVSLVLSGVCTATETYNTEQYEGIYGNMKVVVDAPEDGSKLSSGQSVAMDIIVFFDGDNRAENFVIVYQNGEPWRTYKDEDIYEEKPVMKRNKGETERFMFSAVDGFNGTESFLLALDYSLPLDEASAQYDPVWKDNEERQEAETQKKEEDLQYVKMDIFQPPQTKIIMIILATLVGIMAWTLPKLTKVKLMDSDFGSKPNIIILGGCLLGIVGWFIYTYHTISQGNVLATTFMLSMYNFAVLTVIIVSFLLQYILSFTLTSIPDMEYIGKLFQNSEGDLVLQLIPVRWYTNKKGQNCLVLKGYFMAQRLFGGHMIIKVAKNEILKDKIKLANGKKVTLIGDFEMKEMGYDQVPELEEEIKEQEEQAGKIKGWFSKRGRDKIFYVEPSPHAVRGQAFFLSLFNDAVGDQFKEQLEEGNKARKVVEALRKYGISQKIAEYIYMLFNMNPSEIVSSNHQKFKNIIANADDELEKKTQKSNTPNIE